MTTRPPAHVLESVLYAKDLEAAERFYGDLLGLERITRSRPPRFFRCGPGTVLVFNPDATARGGTAGLASTAAWRDRSRSSLLRCRCRRSSIPGAASSKRWGSPSRPISNGRRVAARSMCVIPPATASNSPSRASGGAADRRRLCQGRRSWSPPTIRQAARDRGAPATPWHRGRLATSHGLAEPEETGMTFAANAVLKARAPPRRAAVRRSPMIPG